MSLCDPGWFLDSGFDLPLTRKSQAFERVNQWTGIFLSIVMTEGERNLLLTRLCVLLVTHLLQFVYFESKGGTEYHENQR